MSDNQNLEAHKKFAIELFNITWDLIEKEDRTIEEQDRMIHSAHGSRYHWELAGTEVNIARGEWLISRVYAILKRIEPCLHHADRCLKITLENNLQDFDLAFGYEAMARACNLAGDEVQTAKYVALAEEAGAKIKEKGDRDYFFSELKSVNPIV
jgi:hypothetical protein